MAMRIDDEDPARTEPPAEDPRLTLLLTDAFALEVEGNDWSLFQQKVDERIARIELAALPSEISRALVASSAAQVNARDWSAFSRSVLARIEADIATELGGGDPRIGA